MKLRIKNNSLRYRLTKSDVAQLSENGFLEDQVDFAGQAFTYALQLTYDSQLSATLTNNTITLFAPRFMIDELVETAKVGFENNSGTLSLLLEKDFTCLDNVAEDQSDNYPNPLAEKVL